MLLLLGLGSGGRIVGVVGGVEAGIDGALALALVVAFAGMLRGLAPEELEKASVATAHVVRIHGSFLKALDSLGDHATDEGAFLFCHCCCASGLGVVRD